MERVNQVDGVPEDVVTDAESAFALRRAGDRLAALTFDSWAEPAAAGLRSSSVERHRQRDQAVDGVLRAARCSIQPPAAAAVTLNRGGRVTGENGIGGQGQPPLGEGS